MKKILIVLLAMIYMVISSGIAVEIHYCMGRFAGMELYGSGNDQCGRCGMKEKKTGCCHDEHSFIKLTDNYKNVSNEISIKAPEKAIAENLSHNQFQEPVTEPLFVSSDYTPPDHFSTDLCVMNCVFRL